MQINIKNNEKQFFKSQNPFIPFILDNFVFLGSLPDLYFLLFISNFLTRIVLTDWITENSVCWQSDELMDKYWYLKLTFNTSSDLCYSSEILNLCGQEQKVCTLVTHHHISSNISVTLLFMNYQDPACGISVIKIMFHGKIPSEYGDHTIRYFWMSFVIKKTNKQNKTPQEGMSARKYWLPWVSKL